MPNEFVARNGLISQNNVIVTGSIIATGGITISGSVASASYASNAELLDGLNSTVFTLTSSFTAQTASFTAFTSSINSFSASILTYTSSLNTKTSSFATTGSNTFIGTEIISGSLTISGSGTPFTLNTDVLEITGSLIVTGSTTITGSLLQSGNYTTTGTITAQTINVQQVTSSIVYSCGSNNFGTAIGNTQVFTGSMFITGSTLTVNGGAICTTGNTCIGGTTVIAGNTGIGTSSPDVFSRGYSGRILGVSSAGQSAIELNSATGNGAYIDMGINGTRYFGIYSDSISSDISTIGNYPLTLSINSTPRLGISSTGIACFACQVCAPVAIFSGCVGIGTSSPAGSLEVVGSGAVISRFNSTAANGGVISFQRSGTAILDIGTGLGLLGVGTNNDSAIYSTATMYLGANGTQFVTLRSGNVGIGTTNPGVILDVKFDSSSTDITGSGASSLRLLNTCAANTNNFHTGIWFRLDNGINNKNGYIKLVNDATNAVGDFAFILTQSGTESERLRIKGNGCVSIGTTCTLGRLTINSSAGTSGITLLNDTAATSGTETQFITWEGLTNGGNLHSCPLGRIGVVNVNGGTSIGDMVFFTKQYNAGICERMRVTSGGNVGVGTTDIDAKFKIFSNSEANLMLSTTSKSSVNLVAQTQAIGLADLDIEANNIKLYTGTIERMRITSGGVVLIGTTSNSSGSPTFYIQNKSGLVANIAGFNFSSTTTAENGNNNILSSGAYYNGSAVVATQTTATLYQQYNGEHLFYTNAGLTGGNSFSGTERMRITSGGNVGIGTTSPSSTYGTLTVAGTGISIADDGNAKLQIGRYNASVCNAYIKMGANACSLRFTNAADTVDVVVMEKGGNIGIGTSSPRAILSIEQDYTAVAEFGSQGQLSISGKTNPEKRLSMGFNTSADVGFIQAMVNGVSYNNLLLNARGGRVGIQNTSPQGILEVGVVDANSTYGGHFFSTFTIPVNTWYTIFYAPNNTWAAITEFTWTSAADFNRSGAAYMRWAYEAGGATLGVVYTLFNNSQNSTATFRNSGGEIQVNITGGAANYYVQVRIQGSKAA